MECIPAPHRRAVSAAADTEPTQLLDRLDELRRELETLDGEPEPTLEILRERREATARTLQSDIDQIEHELELALTGIEPGAFEEVFAPPPTDLQAELFEFVQPFLVLLRSACRAASPSSSTVRSRSSPRSWRRSPSSTPATTGFSSVSAF